MSDDELLDAVATDPDTGLRAVLAAHGPLLLGRLQRYALDKAFGDIDVDDVFVEAVRRLVNPDERERIRRRGGGILPWLSRWGYWRLGDRNRERRSADRRASDPQLWSDISAEPSRAAAQVSEVLPLLRPRDRDVLAWKYAEQLTNDEIAQRLGTTSGAAKKVAHDARRRARTLLEQRGINFET